MRQFLLVGCSVVVLCAGGCESPLQRARYAENIDAQRQVEEILKLAPLGTSSDKAEKALAEAGIVGNFGSRRNIYYCDLWRREGNADWKMNVALLFDEQGKLYKIRPGQAEVAYLPSETAATDTNARAEQSAAAVGTIRQTSAEQARPDAQAAEQSAEAEDAAGDNSRRGARRTPFSHPDELR